MKNILIPLCLCVLMTACEKEEKIQNEYIRYFSSNSEGQQNIIEVTDEKQTK